MEIINANEAFSKNAVFVTNANLWMHSWNNRTPTAVAGGRIRSSTNLNDSQQFKSVLQFETIVLHVF